MFNFFKVSTVNAQTPTQGSDSVGDLVGSINVPQGVDLINADTGVEGGIGIIIFVSNMIKLFTMIGGVWILFNLFMAGFAYITGGGKSESSTKVKNYFTYSVIGLILMISAYAVAALIGLAFYGNSSYIISPTIEAISGATP